MVSKDKFGKISCWKRKSKTLQNRKSKKIFKKTQEKQTINYHEINFFLKGSPHFIGIVSEDKISSLFIISYPISFVVKITSSYCISIWIDEKNLEIFDINGFTPETWSYFPDKLLEFLSRYSQSHNFKVSPSIHSVKYSIPMLCAKFVKKRPEITFDSFCSRYCAF